MTRMSRALPVITLAITAALACHDRKTVTPPKDAAAFAATTTTWEQFDAKDLGDCVTIDSSPNDNGALQCVRDARGQHYVPHDSVATAMRNLSGCVASSMNANLGLVGHGMPAAVMVGSGMQQEPNKRLMIRHLGEWNSDVDNLSDGGGRLTILSCETGTGQAGLNLLKKIADLTQRTVRARTGFTVCQAGTILFEPASVWNEVSPGGGGAPIPPIDPGQLPLLTQLTIAGRTYGIQSVKGFDVATTSSPRIGTRMLALPDRNIEQLVSLIDFSRPFTPPGEPLAVVTATITMHFDDGRSANILIYANRIARDPMMPSRFFHIDKNLTVALEAMDSSD